VFPLVRVETQRGGYAIRRNHPKGNQTINELGVDEVARTVLTEAVGTVTVMGVHHTVDSLAVADGLRDFPVAERLDLRTDVADHGAEVLHAELARSLAAREGLARGEVVQDATTVRNLGSSHYEISKLGLKRFTPWMSARHIGWRFDVLIVAGLW